LRKRIFMKFGLSEQLAKRIAESIMSVVPYNINVMNNEGIIIASGDKNRIGMLHQGALKAIYKNGPHEVQEETITDKPGVNLPFTYQNEIVGVIGISGAPEEVRSLVYVIKVVAELMIEQQYIINKDLNRKFQYENFLREWCDTPREEYSEAFRRQAKEFGVDVEENSVGALLEVEKPRSSLLEAMGTYLHENEFLLRYKENIVAIFRDLKTMEGRLRSMKEVFPDIRRIGLGIRTNDVADSLKKARKALALAKKLGQDSGQDLVCFERYRIHDMIVGYEGREVFERILGKLQKQDGSNELNETLTAYFKYSGDIGKITQSLHIHRNTLAYRIQKIEELTKRSLKNYDDKFYFYVANIVYQLK